MRLHRFRGFTLIEALISAAIMSVILAGVGAVVVGTQTAVATQFESKSATEGTSVTMGYLDRTMRLAGYGIDPALAFNFSVAGLPPATGLTAKDNFSTHTNTDNLTPGFDTDDLAFRYRDPSYSRRAAVAGGGGTVSLALTTALGQNLDDKQLMMVMCGSDPSSSIYGRVSGAAGPGSTSLTLTNAGDTEIANIPVALPGCMLQSGPLAPFVMIVHEVRLRVVLLGPAANRTPYLVAFRNFRTVDPLNADARFDPIVPNVESFQVGYQMNTVPGGQVCCNEAGFEACCAATGPGPLGPCCTKPMFVMSNNRNDGLLGDGLGWVSADGTAGGPVVNDRPDPTLTAPNYQNDAVSPPRFTTHPANIRAVRVSLVLRSARPLASRRKASHPLGVPAEAYSGTVQLENFNYALPADAVSPEFYKFFRVASTQTFRTPSMGTRFPFIPPTQNVVGSGRRPARTLRGPVTSSIPKRSGG